MLDSGTFQCLSYFAVHVCTQRFPRRRRTNDILSFNMLIDVKITTASQQDRFLKFSHTEDLGCQDLFVGDCHQEIAQRKHEALSSRWLLGLIVTRVTARRKTRHGSVNKVGNTLLIGVRSLKKGNKKKNGFPLKLRAYKHSRAGIQGNPVDWNKCRARAPH